MLTDVDQMEAKGICLCKQETHVEDSSRTIVKPYYLLNILRDPLNLLLNLLLFKILLSLFYALLAGTGVLKVPFLVVALLR